MRDQQTDGISKDLVDCIGTACAAGREALQFNVAGFQHRQKHNSLTHLTLQQKPGDLCFKKTMSWLSNMLKKLSFCIVIDGVEVKKRVASNMFF